MNKKKLLKTIAATIVCSAMGISAFSFVGCEPGEGGEGGETGHKHNYTWVDDENGITHHEHCGVAGCDVPDKAAENHVDGNSDNTCDKCGAALSTVEYDTITTSVNFKAAANELAGAETTAEQTVGSDGYTYGGKIFFTSGNRFEPGKNCVNTQKKDITITLGGVINSIKIVGQGASGTGGDIVLKDSSGNAIDTATSTGNGVDVALSGSNLPAGVYTIVSGTSVRIYELTITEKLEQSEATGIKVTASKVDYLINEDFSESGLTVTLNYANGRKDTLASTAYTVTQSVDKTKAGKYTVTVKYKENEEFTATYDVYYYTIDSIEMHTIGYDGKNQLTLQQATITGGTISSNYLTVKGTGTVEGRTHTFNLPAAALNIDSVSTATAGEKTVNVSVKGDYTSGDETLTCDYKVMVKDKAEAVNNKVELTVGETGDFKTLTQAVQYLKACNLGETVNKVIKLQAGTYEEKVWIDMPNVTLIGAGVDNTKLTYSLVEGDADAINGSLWGLGCATLHVAGKNFKAYNLSIHNDFDYIANHDKYSGNQAAQGLALTLDGDGNVIYNCHLYGNQDTLFMKSGRTYYYKTQIDGNVDFIFGNESALAYFDECKIVAINRTAVGANGKGGSQNGYVTAAKHDDKTKPDYGYVFNNCEFTDDGKVADGAMSLGRPWGAKATVAYINCSFSAAYSKQPSNEGKDNRWHDWNTSTTAANADFCEYGSTGAGAITEAVLGGRILTETEAANYTKANVFGTSNGKQNYGAAFNCDEAYTNLKILAGLETGDVTVDPTVEIDFTVDKSQPAVGTLYADKLEWAGTGRWNGNSIQVSTDTVITMKVAGRVSVSWYSGQGTNDDILITYDANGCATIKVVRASGKYMTGLTVDTSDKPAQTQTVNVTLDYNYEGSTNGTVVAAVGSPLAKPADPVREGYKFTGWKVNGVDYTFTENVTEAFTLVAQWEVANDYDLTAGGTVNLYEFTTGQLQGSTGTYRGIIVDATTGKFAPRSNDVQVNAGIKIKFKVADGTTADKISVSFTAAAGNQYLPTTDPITVETIDGDTYAVVSITNACYPSTMTVTIS